MWSAMAVTARRTVAKVKSSAMRPRQPEVPNLMGESAVFAEALMGGYSTRAGITLKEVTEKGHDKDERAISDCVGYVCFDCRGTEDWAECGGEEVGGLREYRGRSRFDLSMEGESGAGAGGFGGDENYGGTFARTGKGSEAHAQLRCTGIHRTSDCGGVARIFEMDCGEHTASRH